MEPRPAFEALMPAPPVGPGQAVPESFGVRGLRLDEDQQAADLVGGKPDEAGVIAGTACLPLLGAPAR